MMVPLRHVVYYVLADDAFFDYSTATSKGTKMPRGDKTAIMQYEVPHFDLSIQKKIAGILADIDDKIALNSNINKNLDQQAQAYFDELFVVNADPNCRNVLYPISALLLQVVRLQNRSRSIMQTKALHG